MNELDEDEDELEDDDFFLNDKGRGGGILHEEKTFTFIPKEDKVTSHQVCVYFLYYVYYIHILR